MEKKVQFSSYDGTNLVGIVSLPKRIDHAILMVHGLPSDKNEWGFYKDMACFFHERNIATFRFDIRYNGESEEGNLSDLTLSEMINDIESAYWTLIRELKGEIIKISIVGTSCGGGVSIKWNNEFDHSVDRIFLNAPVLDYEFEVTNEVQKKQNKNAHLSSDNIKALLENGTLNSDVGYGYSMINEAHLFSIQDEFKKCSIPITIFQGNEDTIVPIHLTERNIKGFDNIELVIVDKANHGFAVSGDEELTDPGTKDNHYFVYNEMYKRLQHE